MRRAALAVLALSALPAFAQEGAPADPIAPVVLSSDPSLDMLARLGVLILLFEVGFESTVAQMVKVGASSFFVALFGVAAPFALGLAVGAWLLPDRSIYVHAFLGAALSATSVGIMGTRTDLSSFTRPGVLALAAALTVAAIIGKQVCSFGAVGKDLDRLSIGLGMIPRGEVGLIFANIGLTLKVRGERVVDEATFAAVVVMAVVTTMVTPPALKWSLSRKRPG